MKLMKDLKNTATYKAKRFGCGSGSLLRKGPVSEASLICRLVAGITLRGVEVLKLIAD
jgi:hypothetical protein